MEINSDTVGEVDNLKYFEPFVQKAGFDKDVKQD